MMYLNPHGNKNRNKSLRTDYADIVNARDLALFQAQIPAQNALPASHIDNR